MKRISVVSLMVVLALLPVMGVNCDSGSDGDDRAIEDTIRGYISSYNASDFDECVTYFTDYSDEDDAKEGLAFFRALSGELQFKEIGNIAITNQTAMVTVAFTIGGEEGTDEMHLRKVQGRWKILWEEEGATLVPDDQTVVTDSAINEYSEIQAGVLGVMSDNNLTLIPNPVSSTTATNSMSAFPDEISNAANGGKVCDPWGNPYTFPGDKPGYVLYMHDNVADGNQTLVLNYQLNFSTTTYYYTVEADGTVRQYADAAKTTQLNGPP